MAVRDHWRAALEAAGLDPGSCLAYALPLTDRFRGTDVREGLLVRGASGWGDFCPFPEYGDAEAAAWARAAVESACEGWPPARRTEVPVNAIVPAVPASRAHQITRASGCDTVKVKVADRPGSHADDVDRVAAVRDALGPRGRIRVDVNGRWDVDTALRLLPDLDRAAGGLDYVEQPCADLAGLAEVRRRSGVRVAADESVRRADDPLRVAVAGAADVVVLKASPLGGVGRAVAVAEAAGLPVVVSSALESAVGLAAEVALAGALPALYGACGLGTGALLAHDVAARGAAPGTVAVPAVAPAPDLDGRERWEQPDPARATWWIERFVRVLALAPGRRADHGGAP